jgi:hypothetical protein
MLEDERIENVGGQRLHILRMERTAVLLLLGGAVLASFYQVVAGLLLLDQKVYLPRSGSDSYHWFCCQCRMPYMGTAQQSIRLWTSGSCSHGPHMKHHLLSCYASPAVPQLVQDTTGSRPVNFPCIASPDLAQLCLNHLDRRSYAASGEPNNGSGAVGLGDLGRNRVNKEICTVTVL